MAKGRVFLSYRRHDSAAVVGRLADHLTELFGADAVFKDVDSIAPGEDFREALRTSIERCDAVLVVIGPKWLEAQPGASVPRLFEDGDFVRAEIEQGIAGGVVLIPVLVDGAAMPAAASLPPSVRELAYRQAAPLRGDPDFHSDLARMLARPPFELEVDVDERHRRTRVERPSGRTLAVVGAAAALLVAVLVVAVTRGGRAGSAAATVPTTTVGATVVPTAPPSPSLAPTPAPTPAGGSLASIAPVTASATVRDAAALLRVSSVVDPGALAVPAEVIEVAADSTLSPQGSTTYDARNLVDRDPATAWTEGVAGLGEGTRITFRFATPMPLQWVEVWPGWQSSIPCRFEKNARPVELAAEGLATDGARSATAEPLEANDPRSRIVITLSLATYYEVTLTITKAIPGERCGDGPFEDTAISEVRFFSLDPCPAAVVTAGRELPVPGAGGSPLPTSC